MFVAYQLLPLTRLGEFSITMVDEDEIGLPYFVDATSMTLGDPPRTRVEINADLRVDAFDRAQPDFLLTTKGIPLVSARFLALAHAVFAEEVHAVAATLRLDGGSRDYFALRTTVHLPLIDPDESAFVDLADTRILTDPVFVDHAPRFHLARDETFRGELVAAPRLVELIEQHRLRLTHLPYSTGA